MILCQVIETTKPDFIQTTKDIFQILFFIVIGIITILSYLQARKTLFTPIKTEIFKMQTKEFEEVIKFFQNKTEIDFMNQFDLNKIFTINLLSLFDFYANKFFPGKLKANEESRVKINSEIAGSIVSQKFMDEHFELVGYKETNVKKKENEIPDSPAIILKQWNEFEYGKIDYTKVFAEESEKIRKFLASPLLPKELKEKIKSFDQIKTDNLSMVGIAMNKFAPRLPDLFPNANSITKFEISGFWNDYNDMYEKLEPKAQEILDYINSYLKIDKLVKQ
jgi:hypothetical protein